LGGGVIYCDICWSSHNYSFSINAAAPMPVAVHIEITPYFPFYLFNSGSNVATYLAPVHPI